MYCCKVYTRPYESVNVFRPPSRLQRCGPTSRRRPSAVEASSDQNSTAEKQPVSTMMNDMHPASAPQQQQMFQGHHGGSQENIDFMTGHSGNMETIPFNPATDAGGVYEGAGGGILGSSNRANGSMMPIDYASNSTMMGTMGDSNPMHAAYAYQQQNNDIADLGSMMLNSGLNTAGNYCDPRPMDNEQFMNGSSVNNYGSQYDLYGSDGSLPPNTAGMSSSQLRRYMKQQRKLQAAAAAQGYSHNMPPPPSFSDTVSVMQQQGNYAADNNNNNGLYEGGAHEPHSTMTQPAAVAVTSAADTQSVTSPITSEEPAATDAPETEATTTTASPAATETLTPPVISAKEDGSYNADDILSYQPYIEASLNAQNKSLLSRVFAQFVMNELAPKICPLNWAPSEAVAAAAGGGLSSSPSSTTTLAHPASPVLDGGDGRGMFAGRSSRRKPERELHHKVMSVLSRVTPEKYDALHKELLDLPLRQADETQLDKVVEVFFQKAIQETKFSKLYADLVASIFHSATMEAQQLQASGGEDLKSLRTADYAAKTETLANQLRFTLLSRCQEEFKIPFHLTAQDLTDKETGKLLDLEGKDAKRQTMKRRLIGNIRFVGELYLNKMVSNRVIEHVLDSLVRAQGDALRECENESRNNRDASFEAMANRDDLFEVFVTLLTTAGPVFEEQRPESTRKYLNMCGQQSKAHPTPRIRFLLMNLVDLANRNWLEAAPGQNGGTPQRAGPPQVVAAPSSVPMSGGLSKEKQVLPPPPPPLNKKQLKALQKRQALGMGSLDQQSPQSCPKVVSASKLHPAVPIPEIGGRTAPIVQYSAAVMGKRANAENNAIATNEKKGSGTGIMKEATSSATIDDHFASTTSLSESLSISANKSHSASSCWLASPNTKKIGGDSSNLSASPSSNNLPTTAAPSSTTSSTAGTSAWGSTGGKYVPGGFKRSAALAASKSATNISSSETPDGGNSSVSDTPTPLSTNTSMTTPTTTVTCRDPGFPSFARGSKGGSIAGGATTNLKSVGLPPEGKTERSSSSASHDSSSGREESTGMDDVSAHSHSTSQNQSTTRPPVAGMTPFASTPTVGELPGLPSPAHPATTRTSPDRPAQHHVNAMGAAATSTMSSSLYDSYEDYFDDDSSPTTTARGSLAFLSTNSANADANPEDKDKTVAGSSCSPFATFYEQEGGNVFAQYFLSSDASVSVYPKGDEGMSIRQEVEALLRYAEEEEEGEGEGTEEQYSNSNSKKDKESNRQTYLAEFIRKVTEGTVKYRAIRESGMIPLLLTVLATCPLVAASSSFASWLPAPAATASGGVVATNASTATDAIREFLGRFIEREVVGEGRHEDCPALVRNWAEIILSASHLISSSSTATVTSTNEMLAETKKQLDALSGGWKELQSILGDAINARTVLDPMTAAFGEDWMLVGGGDDENDGSTSAMNSYMTEKIQNLLAETSPLRSNKDAASDSNGSDDVTIDGRFTFDRHHINHILAL